MIKKIGLIIIGICIIILIANNTVFVNEEIEEGKITKPNLTNITFWINNVSSNYMVERQPPHDNWVTFNFTDDKPYLTSGDKIRWKIN